MMMIERQVEFEALRGLGPDTVMRSVYVGLDDLEDGTPDAIIRDMVIADAKAEMRRLGYQHFWVRDIVTV